MRVTKRNLTELPGLLDLPPFYSTEKLPVAEKVAVLKFFNPSGSGTWYAVEAMAEVKDGSSVPLKDVVPGEVEDITCFGFCVSPLGPDCNEWGYFNLAEFASIRGPMGLGIELDQHWKPAPIPAVHLGRAA